MSVEILTVSLSDESIERIALIVANQLAGNKHSVTQSNPPSAQNPQSAERSTSQGPADPWQNQNNGGGQQYQNNGGQQNQSYQGQQQQGQYQNNGQQQQGQYQNNGQQQQQGHNCAHGQMTFVPAGQNHNTGEAYNAYYKCPLQRGTQGRCRNVYV